MRAGLGLDFTGRTIVTEWTEIVQIPYTVEKPMRRISDARKNNAVRPFIVAFFPPRVGSRKSLSSLSSRKRSFPSGPDEYYTAGHYRIIFTSRFGMRGVRYSIQSSIA